MLKSLRLENFTVFSKALFGFGANLNVIVGENGTGKSHILKAAYSIIAVSAAQNGLASWYPEKAHLQIALAEKFQSVFRPDHLGRLVRRGVGRGKAVVAAESDDFRLNTSFSISSLDRVTVRTLPTAHADKLPVFLPTRELLTIAPDFIGIYETTNLPFEGTWRDTCVLLAAPLARGAREAGIRRALQPLEKAMGGKIETDKSGRFYLKLKTGSMEMHLVAEGLRKLAMVARLIATGSLLEKGYLFWDEPESNLNPRMIRAVASTIIGIAKSGVQVFIASHSLFLLRELDILQQEQGGGLETSFFGLHCQPGGSVAVQQGATMDDIGSIASLDEDLEQADRYIDVTTHAPVA